MDISLRIAIFTTFLPFILGCSPEAWVEPTLESKTHYANIIAIGNVTKILERDPSGVLGETYGAEVKIQCTYKGGVLPGYITIGGAGM